MRSWLRLTLNALKASPSLRRNSRRMTLSRVTVLPGCRSARRRRAAFRPTLKVRFITLLFGVAVVGRAMSAKA